MPESTTADLASVSVRLRAVIWDGIDSKVSVFIPKKEGDSSGSGRMVGNSKVTARKSTHSGIVTPRVF